MPQIDENGDEIIRRLRRPAPIAILPTISEEEIAQQTLIEADVMDQRRRDRIQHYVRQGVINPSSVEEQIELLNAVYPSGFADITGQDVPSNIQTGTQNVPTIILNDPPFKQSRVYALRPPYGHYNLYRAQSFVPTNVNGAALTLRTTAGPASNKVFWSAEMAFWTTAARAAKETSTARTLTLERIITQHGQGGETPAIITRFIIYQATATINPTDRTASDVIVRADPLHLARDEELLLTISSTAADVFVDCAIYMGVA